MLPKNFGFAWMLAVIFWITPLTASAENSQDFGQYVVHFNALPTDMLPPKVASEYRITRSRHRGMLNVTVLKKVLGTAGQPVHAGIEVQAMNLAGQNRKINVREIREANAIYYIGDFHVTHEETMKFTINVQPEGATDTFTVKFSQDFYTH